VLAERRVAVDRVTVDILNPVVIKIADVIGRKYSDETRTFAAGGVGDIYNRVGDDGKAVECYKFGIDVLDHISKKDYFYAKIGISYQKEEMDALLKHLSDSLKLSNKKLMEEKDEKKVKKYVSVHGQD